MARQAQDGRVWGRAEALDTLGRLPGRRRRSVGMLLGVAAVVMGAYLGLADPARGQSAPPVTPSGPAVQPATCATVGVRLSASRIPTEGIAERNVVSLSRADRDGNAELLVPRSYVLKSAPGPEDTVQLSVLIRSDSNGPDAVQRVNGANADNSLSAAVLYDVNAQQVFNECRTP